MKSLSTDILLVDYLLQYLFVQVCEPSRIGEAGVAEDQAVAAALAGAVL